MGNPALLDPIERSCGDCSECCRFEEPDAHDCVFLDPGGSGCAFYSKRPARCQTFRCLWLDGLGDEKLQPHLTGVVFVKPKHGSSLWMAARNPIIGYYNSHRMTIDDALIVARRLRGGEYDLIGLGDLVTKHIRVIGDLNAVQRALALRVKMA